MNPSTSTDLDRNSSAHHLSLPLLSLHGRAPLKCWRLVNFLLSHQQFQGCTSAAQLSSMLPFKPQLSYSHSVPLSATLCQNKNQWNGTEIPEQQAACVALTSCDSHEVGVEQQVTCAHTWQCYSSSINPSAIDGCTTLSSLHPTAPQGPEAFCLDLNFIFPLSRTSPQASGQRGNLWVRK